MLAKENILVYGFKNAIISSASLKNLEDFLMVSSNERWSHVQEIQARFLHLLLAADSI